MPIPSICTSAVPAGQPDPSSEIPRILTLEGPAAVGANSGALSVEAVSCAVGAATDSGASRAMMARSFMMR